MPEPRLSRKQYFHTGFQIALAKYWKSLLYIALLLNQEIFGTEFHHLITSLEALIIYCPGGSKTNKLLF